MKYLTEKEFGKDVVKFFEDINLEVWKEVWYQGRIIDLVIKIGKMHGLI